MPWGHGARGVADTDVDSGLEPDDALVYSCPVVQQLVMDRQASLRRAAAGARVRRSLPACGGPWSRRRKGEPLRLGGGRRIRTVPQRAAVIDLVVATTAFAVSAGILARRSSLGLDIRSPDVAAYALLAVLSGAAVWRRRAPAPAAMAALLAGVVYAAAQYPVALTPIALLPMYTAATVLPPRQGRALLATGVLLGTMAAVASPGPTDIAVPAYIGAAWLLGTYVGSQRRHAAELERKNDLLKQAQSELAEQAATAERLHIARELHDVVAHTMGVVAVHAGAARLTAGKDPAGAQDALATIETASRAALVEMRGLLGMLRQPGGTEAASLGPVPGLGDLDVLVADVVGAGATVEVHIEGQRPSVPAGVDLSAYRIMQEALTNVIKHAGPVTTRVVVRYEPVAVTVEVEDDGPSTSRPAPQGAPGRGHGLEGMRERVAMYGGELATGPRPSGGFRVTARLPFGDRS